MKVCSTCQQKYSDSLEYCMQDGTVLSALPDPNATLRLESRPTRSETPQTKRPLTFVIAVVAGGLLLAVLVVVAAVVVYVMSGNQTGTAANPSTNPSVVTADNRGRSDAETKDEILKKIEQINEEIGTALVHTDLETLDRLLAVDYRYENDLGRKFTKQQILTLFRTGNLHYDYVISANSRMDVNNTLTKVVFTAQAQSKGQLQGLRFNDRYTYTNTYEKRSSGWQLVSGYAWYR